MKKIGLIKMVVGFIVSVGVSAIVGNTIKSTTPTNMGTFKKVCVWVGALVIGCMIGDKATEYTENKIDEGVQFIKKNVEAGELN